jgi:hypothetical protein
MKTRDERIVKQNCKIYTKKFGFICEKLNDYNYVEVINEAVIKILRKEL